MSPALEAVLLQILAIIWINVVLSGDNAVVIALACRSLAPDRRRKAIVFGSAAAVLMRIAFTFVVVELMALPYLKLACGVLLLILAVRLVANEEADRDIAAAPSVWGAIRTIALADAVMSLDNVVAIAAAANGSWLLIIFGLALSVPLIVFGSTLMLKVMVRVPLLAWAGAGLLGYVAGNLAASDPAAADWLTPRVPTYGLGAAAAALVLAAAGVWRLVTARRERPRLLDEIDL